MVVGFDTETDGLESGDAVHVVALHDSRTNTAECFVARDDRVTDDHIIRATDAIEAQRTVCSWNGTQFDFRMMAAVAAAHADKRRCASLALTHHDMMLQFASDKGYYGSLESFAVPTLGRGKIGNGADVKDDWARGKRQAVADYCADDAKLTADLYEYGAAHGRLRRAAKTSNKVSVWALGVDIWIPAYKALDNAGNADTSWMDTPPNVVAAGDWATRLLGNGHADHHNAL